MTAPALTIVMTNAGLARFTAAQLGEPVDLTVATIGLTDANFIVAPTLDALPGKFRDITTISGSAIGDNVIHLVLRDDDESAAYTARGFGLFFEDGTLFAVYGQAEPLFSKSVQSSFMAAIDLTFPTPDIDRLTFGDSNWLNPPASMSTAGVVKLLTVADAVAGSALGVVTGAVLKTLLDTLRAALQDCIPKVWRGAANGVASLDGAGKIPKTQIALGADDVAAVPIYFRGVPNGVPTLDAAGKVPKSQIALTAADVGAVAVAARGVAGGVATLDATGIVPLAQLGVTAPNGEDNGEFVLPGGVRVKYGYATGALTSETQYPLAFPTPFANACTWVEADVVNATGSPFGDTQMQEIRGTKTRFGITLLSQSDSGNQISDAGGGFRWRAYGY